MADLKLRGGGSMEEVTKINPKLPGKSKKKDGKMKNFFQVLALEHFLKLEGWTTHWLLPRGWRIRLKRFRICHWEHLCH